MLLPLASFDSSLIHMSLEALGISAGALYYRWLLAKQGVGHVQLVRGPSLLIVIGCVIGAGIGSRVVFWLEMPHLLWASSSFIQVLQGGQSVVGGLLGGWLGVEISKKLLRQSQSTGDLFVFPILLGLMIGRLGCFLAGLADGTHGLPSNLPWAVDFGDGIPRHPTQLYEILFAGLLWCYLAHLKPRLAQQPGLLFKVMLASYLSWRLLIESIKPLPFDYGFGLSGIQLLCLMVLLFYLPTCWRQWRRLQHEP